MTIITATVAEVKIGNRKIEGLLSTEDQQRLIAIPQLVSINLVPPNRSLKQLKALLCLGLPSHKKAKTPLNSKAVNVINLVDFTEIIKKQFKNDVSIAKELVDELVGVSLEQLWCDAFGIKFEEEDRQEWLKARQASLRDRRNETAYKF